MKVLITGANGQLGKALANVFPYSVKVDSAELDITDREKVLAFDLDGVDAIINAAAYTKVDDAERPENLEVVKKVNINGVKYLADAASAKKIPFVHVSTDYVFDGSKSGE